IVQAKDARWVGFGFTQLKPLLVPFLKEPLSFPQYQRSHTQVIFIDEAMLSKQANQVGAAVDQEISAWLRFQLRHLFYDVARDDVCIVPGDISQGAGDNV